MSWLEDYHDGLASDYWYPKSSSIEADLYAWVKDGEESIDSLTHGLSFLEATQEDADIGKEVLDA